MLGLCDIICPMQRRYPRVIVRFYRLLNTTTAVANGITGCGGSTTITATLNYNKYIIIRVQTFMHLHIFMSRLFCMLISQYAQICFVKVWIKIRIILEHISAYLNILIFRDFKVILDIFVKICIIFNVNET
jgi:hypothetical protein